MVGDIGELRGKQKRKNLKTFVASEAPVAFSAFATGGDERSKRTNRRTPSIEYHRHCRSVNDDDFVA